MAPGFRLKDHYVPKHGLTTSPIATLRNHDCSVPSARPLARVVSPGAELISYVGRSRVAPHPLYVIRAHIGRLERGTDGSTAFDHLRQGASATLRLRTCAARSDDGRALVCLALVLLGWSRCSGRAAAARTLQRLPCPDCLEFLPEAGKADPELVCLLGVSVGLRVVLAVHVG